LRYCNGLINPAANTGRAAAIKNCIGAADVVDKNNPAARRQAETTCRAIAGTTPGSR
jgi:hypothetical protein